MCAMLLQHQYTGDYMMTILLEGEEYVTDSMHNNTDKTYFNNSIVEFYILFTQKVVY